MAFTIGPGITLGPGITITEGGSGGSGTPGGSNTQVQFNDANTFGGSSSFTFDKTSNVLTIGGKVSLSNTALSTASTGTLEYDGKDLYFTPLGTERGLISNSQYYRLNSSLAGANVSTAQNLFGVGCNVSASTTYHYEIRATLTKSAGTTTHAVQFGFGGTATVNNIYSDIRVIFSTTGVNTAITGSTTNGATSTQATFTTVTATSASAALLCSMNISGTVSINVAGTFIPQYQLTAAPGGAYTVLAGAYVLIYPVGAAGSNVSVGTWA